MLLEELIELKGFKKTCEVGCLQGKMSARILEIPCVEKHILVDPWKPYNEIGQENSDDKRLLKYDQNEWDRIYTCCCNTMQKYDDRAIIIRDTSVNAAAEVCNFSLDCVILDADHTRKSYASDVVAWVPKIRYNGFFVSHDYSSGWKNIVRVTNDIFKDITRMENGYMYKQIDFKTRVESIVRAKIIRDEA
jgi:hypothetical protein